MDFKELFKIPSTKRKEEEARQAAKLVDDAAKLAEEDRLRKESIESEKNN